MAFPYAHVGYHVAKGLEANERLGVRVFRGFRLIGLELGHIKIFYLKL